MTLYHILGVPRDADMGLLHAAFRRQSALHHPDQPGGNHGAFTVLTMAYAKLRNAAQRKLYDQWLHANAPRCGVCGGTGEVWSQRNFVKVKTGACQTCHGVGYDDIGIQGTD